VEIVKNDFNADKAKILVRLLSDAIKLMHPVVPYISEEIFALIKEHVGVDLGRNIMLSNWPSVIQITDTSNIQAIEELIEAIENIRNRKAILGKSNKKLDLVIRANPDKKSFLEANQAWIVRLTSSNLALISVEASRDIRPLYTNSFGDFALKISKEEAAACIPILDKQIAKLQLVCDRAKGMLNNPKFVDNASSEKVQEEKDKLEELSAKINDLNNIKEALI
jgi:valyl-tRNA synthetase